LDARRRPAADDALPPAAPTAPPHLAQGGPLFGAACARLFWGQLDSDKARRLVECQEKCADDLVWLDQHNALVQEMITGTGVARNPTSAILLAVPVLSIIEATLSVPDATPGSVCAVLRDLFGNPFQRPEINPLWLAARDGTVSGLAQGIYAEGAFDRLPILADALEEVGCTDAALLGHCRSSQRHFRGCWALDTLLGKTDAEPDPTASMRRPHGT
jgi:hypothetical protein